MNTITSHDGTTIAYERTGSGPALILVDGALCHRAFGPSKDLAEALKAHFTVYTYDRRGRGSSGDARAYEAEREVEDLKALIKEAGGSAYIFGQSSGAALALEAANRLGGITKLATFEAPFIVDGTHPGRPDDVLPRMRALVDAGKRGAAVGYFMKIVGAPGIAVAMMRLMPVFKKLKAVAHTLPYDLTILEGTGSGKPLAADRYAGVTIPTLVMDGGKSPEYMRNSQRAIAAIVAGSTHKTLPGQTHMLKAEAVAPELVRFFSDS
jgi:pimeloyl-ACP methyl ester carboxylesterase